MADWGEEEEEENVDQQTNDSYETSETSADIKPVLQQPNFGELIAEAVDYLPPSLKISSVKTNKVSSISNSDPSYLYTTYIFYALNYPIFGAWR